ncbi:MAG TPA: FAD-dependent monooxygenase [Gammaproteobacteria bacterium]|nr:FAD-dependent monooxygenase [Gammaproteobacteria bacterium]
MSLETLPEEWDVVVVGAGVAGTVSASRLARRGLSVLLTDKAQWPRHKACGGCINAAALRALAAAGLADISGAGPAYGQIHLACGRHQAVLALPRGRALSRRRLDAMLADHAIAAGARFLPSTQATLNAADAGSRGVTLRCGDQRATVRAQLVLASDGLGSRLLGQAASTQLQVDEHSRIGVGTVVAAAPPFYQPGSIYMACGAQGYVGLVRVEHDQLNIGAALDPAWVKRCGGPAAAVAQTLQATAFPTFDALRAARWHGTPRLTQRRRRLGAERVLALGDAAGYVEPFTGEGMAWALVSAAAVEPLALAAAAGWRDELVDQWTARQAALLRPRQRTCRALSMALRRPRLVAALLPLLKVAPMTVAPLTAWLNRDFEPGLEVDQ